MNGLYISIQNKRFDKLFTHVPEDGDYPDKLFENWWEKAEAFGVVENEILLAVNVVNSE